MQSGETHIDRCLGEEETIAKLEDALFKAKSEVEDKGNLIDHLHKEMLKMQQGKTDNMVLNIGT